MTIYRKPSLSLRVTRHVVLCATGAFMLLPFIWMLSTSVKSPPEIFRPVSLWSLFPTQGIAVDNYIGVFTQTDMVRFLANGLVVCFGILAFQLTTAFPCAYALAKLRFVGRERFFLLTIATLIIPGQALVIPLYILFYYLGLLNTYLGLILPHCISPFGIFLFRQFFRSVPDDYVHAARIDGMSELGIVLRVMVPLALPAVLAFSAFSFSSHWNDLLWPMIIVQSRELATPPLGLVFFKTADQGVDYGHMMAAATVIVAPLVLVFFLAQKWFLSGFQIQSR